MELNIRRFEESDAEALYDLLSNAEVMRFIEPPFSEEKTRAFLAEAGLSEPPLIYAVDDENGVFAGYVIYHAYDSDSMEIGWILRRDLWGRGFASSLTGKLVEKARLDGKSAVIECAPEQAASRRIAEKLGFAYTGISDGLCVFRRG